MIYIVSEFPFSWFQKGTVIKNLGYINPEELGTMIDSGTGYVSSIDEITSNVLTMFTDTLITTSHGSFKWLKKGDVVVVVNFNEKILRMYEVLDDEN